MYLGVPATISQWNQERTECNLVFSENPLGDFVVLPPNYQNSLWYSNILSGIIRGSLEMVNIRVKANFVKDRMRGDDNTEIRVQFLEIVKDKIIKGLLD